MAPNKLLDPTLTFAQLFDSVGLDVRLQKAIARLGHVRPTLVQAQCLPLAIRDGRDLLVRARTGSGKTLAYSLPLLQKILSNSKANDGAVQAIVLVPTKELCSQIANVLRELSYYATDDITLAVLSGTTKDDRARQDAMLRDGPSVIVATPASLLHFLKSNVTLQKTVKQSVETLVVDEADLVLHFGYSNDISEIMKHLPKICQGLLLSATLSPELQQLKQVVLHSPAIVKLEEDDDEEEDGKNKKNKLSQFYLPLPRKDKNLVLYVFLKLGLLKGKGLFFVNTTDAAYRLKLFFEQFHIRAAVLNSELPLQSRLHIIEHFNVGNFDYLIATGGGGGDEYGVSRGTDFRLVSFVVNVDLPPTHEEYTHRIGRTARGGHKGVALTLVNSNNQDEWDMLTRIQAAQPNLTSAKGNASPAHPLLQAQRPSDGDDPDAATIVDAADAPVSTLQPSPLDFDLSELEGFRYRVEDVQRAVTKVAVKEARALELKAELLNSERLQSHFDENPADLQLLRHDRIGHGGGGTRYLQDHLKHVPKYMLPRGMQVAELHKRRKKRKIRGASNGARRTDNDPLQNFNDTPGNVDEFFDDGDAKKKKVEEEPKVFTSTKDGTGKSTSGRTAWKEKHKKGKFSNKSRKSDPKKRRVGI